MGIRIRKSGLYIALCFVLVLLSFFALAFFTYSRDLAPGDFLVLVENLRTSDFINIWYSPIEPLYLVIYHSLFAFLPLGNILYLCLLVSLVYLCLFFSSFLYVHSIYSVKYPAAAFTSAIALIVVFFSYYPLSITLQLLRQSLSSALFVLVVMPTSFPLFYSLKNHLVSFKLFKYSPLIIFIQSTFSLRLLLLLISVLLHFSSFLFVPLAAAILAIFEGKKPLPRPYPFLIIAFGLSALVVSQASVFFRFFSLLYSLLTQSTVLSDKIELYLDSYYSLVQYPEVSYRGILALLFAGFILSLSVGRRIQPLLLLPLLAVIFSMSFPQGTIFSHRFFQSARFFSVIPLFISISCVFEYLLCLRKRAPKRLVGF